MRENRTSARAMPISKDVLKEAGLAGLWVTSDVSETILGPLLKELEGENCVHSWRTHLHNLAHRSFEERLSVLLATENSIRPTTTFTYYGLDSEQRVIPVAAATVADRISSEFPFEGFPVIARAYIAREFRGLGLYPFLVRHRLDHCVQEWGRRLRAVHVGSAEPTVWRTVTRGFQFSAPFLHIGRETLHVAESEHEVRDFLSLSETYRQDLSEDIQRGKEWFPSGTPGRRLAEALEEFVSRGASAMSYAEVWSRLESAQRAGHDWTVRCQSTRELLAFCEAIPLMR